MDFAAQAFERLETLGRVSDQPHQLTRQFGSPAMRRANELVRSWMLEAGMQTREDAIGNLIGHFPAARPEGKILLLGSHLDTVPNAGKFDGALGVVLSIACVHQLHQSHRSLPFAIEVIGFADEEGARFQTAYLGSRALAGTLAAEDLSRCDAQGLTLAKAIENFGGDPAQIASCRKNKEDLLGYVEVHIEQGPVLEQRDQALGIVSAIAGQTRAKVAFRGRAAHAGTTPMRLRQDALCAAAQWVLAVEKKARDCAGLVATVGQITAHPNVSNVICGAAELTLDLRHPNDAVRIGAAAELRQIAGQIQQRRGIEMTWLEVQQTPSVECSAELSILLRQAARLHQPEVSDLPGGKVAAASRRWLAGSPPPAVSDLPSGAGHDAAVMAALAPVAMLFVRCKGGVSHHPDESVQLGDISVALATLGDFLSLLAANLRRV